MEILTEKERCCLVTYTYDLLQLMIDDGVAIVSDNKNEYTQDEIENLIQKLTVK